MDDSRVHSRTLPDGEGGELLRLPRSEANWEWMSFVVRRLRGGEVYRSHTEGEEAAFVLLGGICLADWGEGVKSIGKRKDVFDGLPYTLYLPAGHEVTFTGETTCEIAECRVPSNAKLQARLVTPANVSISMRGGGNVSRQIVDVITPTFPADKIMV